MFAEIFSQVKLRSYWIRVGLNPMTAVFHKRAVCTEGRRPPEDRGRDWSDAAANQRLPASTRNEEK